MHENVRHTPTHSPHTQVQVTSPQRGHWAPAPQEVVPFFLGWRTAACQVASNRPDLAFLVNHGPALTPALNPATSRCTLPPDVSGLPPSEVSGVKGEGSGCRDRLWSHSEQGPVSLALVLAVAISASKQPAGFRWVQPVLKPERGEVQELARKWRSCCPAHKHSMARILPSRRGCCVGL